MKYTPVDKFIIESNKSELELISRLQEQIEPKIYFRYHPYNSDKKLKPYEGEIENNSFSINRIIKYRNPFLPKIKGKFTTQYGGGSKIIVKMRIMYLPFIFMVFWSFGPMLFFFTFPENSVNQKTLIPKILISSIWIIIGYFFTYLPFNYERKKSKKFLIDLFKNG